MGVGALFGKQEERMRRITCGVSVCELPYTQIYIVCVCKNIKLPDPVIHDGAFCHIRLGYIHITWRKLRLQ
jgi:hypothetical protein